MFVSDVGVSRMYQEGTENLTLQELVDSEDYLECSVFLLGGKCLQLSFQGTLFRQFYFKQTSAMSNVEQSNWFSSILHRVRHILPFPSLYHRSVQ